MIGVLVGDEDRRQVRDALEAVGEGTGVEQNGHVTRLPAGKGGEKAGMAEVRQLHDPIIADVRHYDSGPTSVGAPLARWPWVSLMRGATVPSVG